MTVNRQLLPSSSVWLLSCLNLCAYFGDLYMCSYVCICVCLVRLHICVHVSARVWCHMCPSVTHSSPSFWDGLICLGIRSSLMRVGWLTSELQGSPCLWADSTSHACALGLWLSTCALGILRSWCLCVDGWAISAAPHLLYMETCAICCLQEHILLLVYKFSPVL